MIAYTLRHLRRPLAVIGVVAILSFVAPESPVHAGVFIVTTTADNIDGTCDSDCSLREAVIAANTAPGLDSVSVPAGTYSLAITGTDDTAASGDLDVTDAVTINGGGSGLTILDGSSLDRVLDAFDDLTLTGVTVRGGSATGGGGGIRASGPVLTINDSRVVDNSSSLGGGVLFSGASLAVARSELSGNVGGDYGGGLAYTGNSASATISDSAISDNRTVTGGAGIYAADSTLTIVRSRIRNNAAPHTGAGIQIGGGRLVVADSEVSGNRATGLTFDGLGGGIYYCCRDVGLSITGSTLSGNAAYIAGGALYLCCTDSTALTREITNSTVTGNSAALHGGAIESGMRLSLANVTLAGNSSPAGGGLLVTQPMSLRNTVVANNDGGDCVGSIVSFGHNLSVDGSCGLGGPGDILGAAPLLGELADNGGGTPTLALLDESPAIDAGDPSGCRDFADITLFSDQRGFVRPVDGDGDGQARCDIGAYEAWSVAPIPTPTPDPTATPSPPSPSAAPTPTPAESQPPTTNPGTATPTLTAAPASGTITPTPVVGAAALPPGGGSRAGRGDQLVLLISAVFVFAVAATTVYATRRGP
jgi:CSLREA domain-containing protein